MGEKNINEINKDSYLLSTRNYNLKIVSEYSLEMYPYELNIINNIKGHDIKLYDMNESNNQNKNDETRLIRYSYKLDMLNRKQNKLLIVNLLKEYYGRFLNKIKRKK